MKSTGVLMVYTLAAAATCSGAVISPPIVEWQTAFGDSTDKHLVSAMETRDGGFALAGYYTFGQQGTKINAGCGLIDFWMTRLASDGRELWNKCFGGSDDDFLYAVVETEDGGFLLAGDSRSHDGAKTGPNFGSYDIWLLRIDMDGNKVWDATFGGTGDDHVEEIALTSDGGFVIRGSSSSDVSGNKSTQNYGGTDAWIIRVDQNGSKLWERSLGGLGYDICRAITATKDGGCLVGADFSARSTFGSLDFWVVRLDSAGNTVWEKAFGGAGVDIIDSVAQTSDGGFALAGFSNSGIEGNKTSDNTSCNDSDLDYWIVRLDPNGTKLWDKTYGGTGVDSATRVLQTSDGGFAIAGRSGSAANGNKTSLPVPGNDFWLVRLDPNGNPMWDATYGGRNIEMLGKVQQSSTGGLLLAGKSSVNYNFELFRLPKEPLRVNPVEFPNLVQRVGLRFSFFGEFGKTYVTEYSGDLQHWQPFQTNTISTNTSKVNIIDRDVTNHLQRFYRIRGP